MKEQDRVGLAQIMPKLNVLNRPFWEGLAQNKLMIQHCPDCGAYIFPPSPICPVCNSENVKWVQASGKATLFSEIVYHKQYLRTQYPDKFKVILAKLEEGPKLFARMEMEADHDFDMPLRATFIKSQDGTYLLGFEPDK